MVCKIIVFQSKRKHRHQKKQNPAAFPVNVADILPKKLPFSGFRRRSSTSPVRRHSHVSKHDVRFLSKFFSHHNVLSKATYMMTSWGFEKQTFKLQKSLKTWQDLNIFHKICTHRFLKAGIRMTSYITQFLYPY